MSTGLHGHELTSFTLDCDGVGINGDRAGPREAPTALLVHGYPDDRSVWDAVAINLAADFHVVRYDVRGSGESDRPRDIAAYRLERLVRDLEAVINAVSPGAPVHLIGHDWGAIQGWEAVSEPRLSGRVASFTALGAPSLDHAGMLLRRHFRQPAAWRDLAQQFWRSWYVAAFQLPGPPLAWRLGLDRAWPVIMQHLEKAPPAATAHQRRNGIGGMAWYRANVIPRLRHPRPRRAHAPILQIICRQDPHVIPATLAVDPRWAPRLEQRELDAGHWLPLSDPAQLAAMIRAFVASSGWAAEAAQGVG